MKYASATAVPVSKSKTEIEALIVQAGGERTGIFTEENRAVVIFEMRNRRIMFELPLPNIDTFRTRKPRLAWQVPIPVTRDQQIRLYEQACRSKWRALYLAIKAKFVSVETGVETFEESFLAQIVVHDQGKSKRFGEVAVKAIEESYLKKNLPPMLGSGK